MSNSGKCLLSDCQGEVPGPHYQGEHDFPPNEIGKDACEHPSGEPESSGCAARLYLDGFGFFFGRHLISPIHEILRRKVSTLLIREKQE
jgi:phage-related protein